MGHREGRCASFIGRFHEFALESQAELLVHREMVSVSGLRGQLSVVDIRAERALAMNVSVLMHRVCAARCARFGLLCVVVAHQRSIIGTHLELFVGLCLPIT